VDRPAILLGGRKNGAVTSEAEAENLISLRGACASTASIFQLGRRQTPGQFSDLNRLMTANPPLDDRGDVVETPLATSRYFSSA